MANIVIYNIQMKGLRFMKLEYLAYIVFKQNNQEKYQSFDSQLKCSKILFLFLK